MGTSSSKIVEKEMKVNTHNITIVSFDMNNINIISGGTIIDNLFNNILTNADIICLQNINEKFIYTELLKKLEDIKKQTKFFVVPTSKDLGNQNISVSIKQIWDGSVECNNEDYINNLIISKYPVYSYFYKKISDTVPKFIVGANINVDNKIYSIYNVNLIDDIKTVFFKNNRTRKKQLEIIKLFTEKNIMKYKNGIHLICGSFCINEINDNKINNL